MTPPSAKMPTPPLRRLGEGEESWLTRRELVAEGAARRALHDGLLARQRDLAVAGRGDVEVGRTHQQRAQLGLVQRLEELGVAAARDIELELLGVLDRVGHIDARQRDLVQRALHL